MSEHQRTDNKEEAQYFGSENETWVQKLSQVLSEKYQVFKFLKNYLKYKCKFLKKNTSIIKVSTEIT